MEKAFQRDISIYEERTVREIRVIRGSKMHPKLKWVIIIVTKS